MEKTGNRNEKPWCPRGKVYGKSKLYSFFSRFDEQPRTEVICLLTDTYLKAQNCFVLM